MDAFRLADEMRYKLMPYIYAQAKDCSENGLPMVWLSVTSIHSELLIKLNKWNKFWNIVCVILHLHPKYTAGWSSGSSLGS